MKMIYIDAENISYQFAPIFTEKNTKIYGDFTKNYMKKWKSLAQKHNFQIIQCEKINKKNSVDIKLAVDTISDLFTKKNIQEFWIVTTDSDLKHIFEKIRQFKNKKVICVGNHFANDALRKSCDHFYVLEELQVKSYFGNKKRLKPTPHIQLMLSRCSLHFQKQYTTNILKQKHKFREYIEIIDICSYNIRENLH